MSPSGRLATSSPSATSAPAASSLSACSGADERESKKAWTEARVTSVRPPTRVPTSRSCRTQFLIVCRLTPIRPAASPVVMNWVRQERLVGTRVGGRTLVTRASVQAFFDSLSSAPEQAESDDAAGAEVADGELVASLPDGLMQRVETLLERARSGQKLSSS